MPQMSQYIKSLEEYKDLESAIIRSTKINKVLKALTKLNTIPRDEEFHFRQRSVLLLSKWTKILGAEPQDSETKGDEAKETAKSTPATNGVHDDAQDDKKDDKPQLNIAPSETEPAATAAENKDEVKPAQSGREAAPAVTEDKPVDPPASAAAPEEPKADVAGAIAEPATSDKAPESAAGATAAAEAVKSAE